MSADIWDMEKKISFFIPLNSSLKNGIWKNWKIQKFKKLRMNDVKKCDVIIWHFGVKINANFIGSIFYIFRPSLV